MVPSVCSNGPPAPMTSMLRHPTLIDPLFDPNRHARVGVVKWTENGPDFGVPEPDNLWTPDTTDVLPADGGALAGTPVAN